MPLLPPVMSAILPSSLPTYFSSAFICSLLRPASDPNCLYNCSAQSPEHLQDMVRKTSCEKRGSQAALSWEGSSRHILSFESALSHRVDELLRRYARDVGIGLSCTTGDGRSVLADSFLA